MRYLLLSLLLCVSFSSPARAQAADPAITAPINAFLAAFNKGDVAGAAATHAAEADLVILDEVAPYAWHGPKAVQAWAADLAAADAKGGLANQQVKLGAISRVETDGSAAYVVVPSVYTFTEKGVAMRANAQMTFHLKKGAGGWLIHGWTWTGPRASKVAAAK